MPIIFGKYRSLNPIQWLRLFFYLLVGGLLYFTYFRVLHQCLIFDDISLMGQIVQSGKSSWFQCFVPYGNGFYRPVTLLQMTFLYKTFGLYPYPFHLMALLIHYCNAILMGYIIYYVLNMNFFYELLGVVFFAFNFAAHSNVILISSSCDSSMICGILASLIMFDKLAYGFSSAKCSACILFYCYALLSKETACICVFIFWIYYFLKLEKRAIDKTGMHFILIILTFITIGFGYMILHLQQSSTSYSSRHLLSFSIKSDIRQECDYIISAFFPFIHVAAMPFIDIHWNIIFLWLLRCIAMSICIYYIVSFFVVQKTPFSFCIISLCIACIPASLLKGSPISRYTYITLPFSAIIVACLVCRASHGRWRFYVYGMYTCLILINIAGFIASPTFDYYISTANYVGAFVCDSIKESYYWKSGDTIAIYSHPHPAPDGYQWVYAQLIYNIYISRIHVNIELDTSKNATFVYRYDKTTGALIKIH